MKGTQKYFAMKNDVISKKYFEESKLRLDSNYKFSHTSIKRSIRSEVFNVYNSFKYSQSKLEARKANSKDLMNFYTSKYRNNLEIWGRNSRNISYKHLKLNSILRNSSSNIGNYLKLVSKNCTAYINPNLTKNNQIISTNIINSIIIPKSEISKSLENMIEEKNTIDNTPESATKETPRKEQSHQITFSNTCYNNILKYKSIFFGDFSLKHQHNPIIYGKKIDFSPQVKPFMQVKTSQSKDTNFFWRRNNSLNVIGSIFKIDSNKLNKMTRKYIMNPLNRLELKIPMTKTIPLPLESEIVNQISFSGKNYLGKDLKRGISETKINCNLGNKRVIHIPRLKLELIKREY